MYFSWSQVLPILEKKMITFFAWKMQICHFSSSIFEDYLASLAVSLQKFGTAVSCQNFSLKNLFVPTVDTKKNSLPGNSLHGYAVWLKALLNLHLVNFSVQTITLITRSSVKKISRHPENNFYRNSLIRVCKIWLDLRYFETCFHEKGACHNLLIRLQYKYLLF